MYIQRQILLLLSFFLSLSYLQSQTNRTVKPSLKPQIFQKKFDESITIVDKDGRPFLRESDKTDIEGTPYFIEEFRYANVILNQGAFYENIKVKIDLNNHEAHVVGDDQKKMIVKD